MVRLSLLLLSLFHWGFKAGIVLGQNRDNQAPSLGTVPGIYYDPSGELSPSIREMGQASEAGVISYEKKDFDERYNIQRVWKRGATPDYIIKVGDLENNPTLKRLINLDNLTLREIAANGGADIDLVPLHSIGVLNSMTVEEFFEVFPQLKNQSIKNVPILLETVSNSTSNVPIAAILTGNGGQIRERTLTYLELELVKNLAHNPANEGIPVEELVTGNWDLVLREEAQQHLQDVLDKYPELRGLPADKLFPIVDGAIAGDWNSVVNQAQDYATKQGTEMLTRELLEAVPTLKDAPLGALPIDQLLVGDVQGLGDVPLSYIPKIANRYLSQLGHLSQTPGTMLIANTAMILLTGDIFGRLDIAFAGDAETPITRVVTGGTLEQKFSPEPCLEESCKHFELVDVLSGNGEKGNVHGKAWIQGSSQSVPGGKGFLRWVNGGEERTGVPVWTTDAHVKLSLEDIDEGGNGEPATARVWLDFQICVYPPFLGEHCTPHFFSFPTPWKVQEGGLMVVFSRASAPDIIEEIKDQIEPENRDYRNRCREIECNTPMGSGIATGTLVNPAPRL